MQIVDADDALLLWILISSDNRIDFLLHVASNLDINSKKKTQFQLLTIRRLFQLSAQGKALYKIKG